MRSRASSRNLIVDQTDSNPAAVIAAEDRADIATFPGMETLQQSADGTWLIPNQSPDIGLSPPFNGMMALFGQFFDHGLDLITKGGGTVYVPLQPDDPLYVAGQPDQFHGAHARRRHAHARRLTA